MVWKRPNFKFIFKKWGKSCCSHLTLESYNASHFEIFDGIILRCQNLEKFHCPLCTFMQCQYFSSFHLFVTRNFSIKHNTLHQTRSSSELLMDHENRALSGPRGEYWTLSGSRGEYRAVSWSQASTASVDPKREPSQWITRQVPILIEIPQSHELSTSSPKLISRREPSPLAQCVTRLNRNISWDESQALRRSQVECQALGESRGEYTETLTYQSQVE